MSITCITYGYKFLCACETGDIDNAIKYYALFGQDSLLLTNGIKKAQNNKQQNIIEYFTPLVENTYGDTHRDSVRKNILLRVIDLAKKLDPNNEILNLCGAFDITADEIHECFKCVADTHLPESQKNMNDPHLCNENYNFKLSSTKGQIESKKWLYSLSDVNDTLASNHTNIDESSKINFDNDDDITFLDKLLNDINASKISSPDHYSPDHYDAYAFRFSCQNGHIDAAQ